MSAQHLQSALIKLVRYPDAYRGEDFGKLLELYDLDEKEQGQLKSLAESYQLQKFGKEQRSKRFDISVRKPMPVSAQVMGTLVFGRKIFRDKFESSHQRLGVADIGDVFFDWFTKNLDEIRAEFGFPEFLNDLVKSEYTEFHVFGGRLANTWTVAEGSKLRQEAPLAVIDLSYDIADFLERVKGLDEAQIQALTANKRSNIQLFAKVQQPGKATLAHQFEIDTELQQFLVSQMGPNPQADHPLPPCYGELVELGICRPVDA